MKNMKKIVALLLATVMVMAMSISAAAQSVPGTDSAENKGSITIDNASKGETYGVIKLFDATVSADGKSIAYTGDIPPVLNDYFEKDGAGNIKAKDAAWNGENMSEGLKKALQSYSESATAMKTAVSDGSALTFNQLPFGYYVVTTTQGETLISVDSTKPAANVVDKNTTEPVIEEGEGKSTKDTNVKIGDTVTYTIKFTTSNYSGAGTDAKQIKSYTITDTLPDYLSNVTVTSIKVLDKDGEELATVTKQFTDKKIVIDWIDKNGNSLYPNKADIVITYTAVVTKKAAVDGVGNKNEVKITYQDKDGKDIGKELKDEETIFTYAVAIKKVDQNGKDLAGATFKLPFYVEKDADTDGAYVYAGTDAKEGLVNTLTTPENGLLVIKGLKSGEEIALTETEAPKGYNKLTEEVKVTPVKTEQTTTTKTIYLDKDGNVVDTKAEGGSEVLVSIENIAATPVAVVNKTGAELPSTGGIGTTMFYVVGSVLVIGAAVVLISKRRMAR